MDQMMDPVEALLQSGFYFHQQKLFKYNYPPANRQIVSRISRALINNPLFYTQVLHLMNKMNLPPPFDSVDTSETEEEDEDEVENSPKIIHEVYRRKPRVLKIGFVGEKTAKKMRPTHLLSKQKKLGKKSDLFDRANLKKEKPSIEINLRKEFTPNSSSQELIDVGTFGVITKETEPEEAIQDDRDYNFLKDLVSEDELRKNRLSSNKWDEHPVLKNYCMGQPNCRLYIKNISKQVEENDLKKIYARYIDFRNENQRNMFDVQLLKKGKLKGQAFVTMPNEELAKRAILETNAYVLNGKPIVVAFARSSKPSSSVE